MAREKNILHRIRGWMEGNALFSKYVPKIQKMKITRYLADREAGRVFQAYYKAHKDEFDKLEGMLEDDFSRETLRAIIEYYRTIRPEILEKVVVKPQYFLKDIWGPKENEVFIDGGACIGDTIKNLIRHFGKGVNYCKKIYAWEPDESNRGKLAERYRSYDNIEIVPCGLWSEKTELHFSALGNASSHVSDSGPKSIQVDSIDNVCAGDKVTFIKMDIEGSEPEALRGARKVICRDKPRLAICLYHNPGDFCEVPFLIKEMVPEYRFYIRHHTRNRNETVLYAVAE